MLTGESYPYFKEVQICGESVKLLSEGVLFWNRYHLLVVADLHLGKTETFSQNGLCLPVKAQQEDLQRLGEICLREKAKSILFLGDLIHTRRGLTPQLEEGLIRTLSQTIPIEKLGSIRLITGNGVGIFIPALFWDTEQIVCGLKLLF
jgi:metallophosphoesterase superfamily enzyme